MTVQEFSAGTFRDLDDLECAITAARQKLFDIQHADGHWCGELEGDTILESEYLLLLYFLGRWNVDANRVRKTCEYLRRKQLADGGWAIYEGGPTDVSASVKAYFVLKLAGDSVEAPHMERARRVILDGGGIEACNSFTKIYLSIFGQYDWNGCPAVPPELILLPEWFVFNIYEMSYWSRAIVVPLSIIWASKPVCRVPDDRRIDELHNSRLQPKHVSKSTREKFWRAFFTVIDRGLKAVDALHIRPFRRRAFERAERWILDHLDASGGLGAIFPPIVNTIFAFRCLGRPADDPLILGQLAELHRLEIEEDDTLHLQPCFSAVWDTALAVHCLCASGTAPDDPRVLAGARWLLDKQTTTRGDWARKNPEGQPGGWYFEYENEFYPDTDDTSEVLLALNAVRFPDPVEERRRRDSVGRAVLWQFTMQNDDGGWGAFDKGCDNDVYTFIPFADHNAMIDPSCEDITGRTVEALQYLGYPREHPVVRKAIDYLYATQTPQGTWYGRWGCNYIYGTWLAARGLAVAGEPVEGDRLQRVVRWFAERQNDDGGWGELQSSYDDPALMGVGPSTPSQTAWALLTLMELGESSSDIVRRGIDYLLDGQREDGSWFDETWTATGFPRVFYLRYHLYATYFPLWALAAYRRTVVDD